MAANDRQFCIMLDDCRKWRKITENGTLRGQWQAMAENGSKLQTIAQWQTRTDILCHFQPLYAMLTDSMTVFAEFYATLCNFLPSAATYCQFYNNSLQFSAVFRYFLLWYALIFACSTTLQKIAENSIPTSGILCNPVAFSAIMFHAKQISAIRCHSLLLYAIMRRYLPLSAIFWHSLRFSAIVRHYHDSLPFAAILLRFYRLLPYCVILCIFCYFLTCSLYV